MGQFGRHMWASWPLQSPGKGQRRQLDQLTSMHDNYNIIWRLWNTSSEDQLYLHLSRHPDRAPSLIPWPRCRRHLTQAPFWELLRLCNRLSSVRPVPRDRARKPAVEGHSRRLCRRTFQEGVVGNDWLEAAKSKKAEGPLAGSSSSRWIIKRKTLGYPQAETIIINLRRSVCRKKIITNPLAKKR